MRYSLFILFVVLSVSLSANGPTGLRILSAGPGSPPPPPSSEGRGASRTTGVAPLSVHFSAGFSSSTTDNRDFHDFLYLWDFGDQTAGTWSTSGKPRNEATGPVATHVFDEPGVYTVDLEIRGAFGVVDTDTFMISVLDPDEVYAGTRTTCVSDSDAFSYCPSGARQVITDDLSTVMQYIDEGTRILFRRGSSWTVSGSLDFPDNQGPVTIGAYGSGNKPRITVTSGTFCNLDYKQDWRFLDLNLVDTTRSNGTFGGSTNIQRILFSGLEIEGFEVGLGWSHYNGSPHLAIDQMVLSDCLVFGSQKNGIYVGGERIALLGNEVRDIHDSHVARVWQAYAGIISHNFFSGSSISNTNGRQALKLHGPGYSSFGNYNEFCAPTPGTPCLENLTEFVVISDNVIGSSGPWPVSIGPQDTATDSEIRDVIVERNRFLSDYGTQSPVLVSVSMHVSGQFFSIRNNIFDGSGSSNDYTGVHVLQRGVEPAPIGIEIYNNTVYHQDNTYGNIRLGFDIDQTVREALLMNNLVSFPDASVFVSLVRDDSPDLESEGNAFIDNPMFINPDASPLSRDFRLSSGSAAINGGVSVPVFEDFYGNTRPNGDYDVGATEY